MRWAASIPCASRCATWGARSGRSAGRRRPAQDRAQQEDAAAAPSREEALGGGAARVERRRQVQSQGLVPARVRDLVEGAVAHRAAASSGHVVKAMESLELQQGGLDGGGSRGRLGGVGHDADGGGAELLFRSRDFFRVAADHNHLRSFDNKRLGRREAETAGAADHNETFIGKPGHGSVDSPDDEEWPVPSG